MQTSAPTRAEMIDMIAAAAEGLAPNFQEAPAAEAYADKMLSAARFELSRDEGQLIGLVVYYANDLNTRLAFITLVSVVPVARKRGIAADLVAQVIERCRAEGFVGITLKVLTNNAAANALYEKLGFVRIDTQHGQHILKRDL